MRKAIQWFRALSMCLAVFALLGTLAWGQSRQNGEIRGTVMDTTQGAIPEAQVTLTNTGTGVIQTTTTGATGAYDFPYVAPGSYAITYEKEGFKTLVRNGITMHVEPITLDVALQVGTIAEQVSVTAETPLVQTESAAKSTTLTSDVVSESPSINRSWYDLLSSVPGVNPGGGEQSSGQGVGVNGQQPFNASWQIDGGIAMFGQSANPDALAPPLESIEEVSLSTANFGAEHGNGLSVFNVITKSGTNRFHGSMYEYIENEFFNAKNYFTEGSKPVQRWNEYGGNLGGPIKKDRAFFFVNYERNPIRDFSPNPQSYPTDAFKTGDFSTLLGGPATYIDSNNVEQPVTNPCTGQQALVGQIYDPATTRVVNGQTCRDPFAGNIIPTGRFDAVANNIQKYFPTAQKQDTLWQNYYWNQANPVTNSWLNAKVDFNITSTNRLSASFLHATFDQQFQDPICEIGCGAWSGTEDQGQITDVWTLRPTLVSEFRFSISRSFGAATTASQNAGWPAKLGMNNPIGDLFPTIWINGALNTQIGNTNGFPPAIDAETTFIPSEVVTWIKGKHIVKFGGEFDRWWVNTGWGTADNGGYWFGGGFTANPADANYGVTEGEGYADFLLGNIDSYWISINPETGGRMWSTQLFAQDAYKVKPNLTLTLGLRYVIQSGWSEVQGRISSFDPTLTNPATGTPGAMWYGGQNGRNALTKTIPDFFAPRVGVAWSPNPNWSVRGGFGVYNIIASQNTTGPAYAWGQGWIPSYNYGSAYNNADGTPNWTMEQGPPTGSIYNPSGTIPSADALNGTNVTYSPYHTPLSYAMEYQLDLQYQWKYGLMFDAGYVGNLGKNLQYGRDLNQLPDAQLGQGQDARPYPQFGNIMAAYFDGRSNYNALQLSVKKQTTRGLTFAVNYTYAKTLDTLTSAGWGGSGASERGGYQDAYTPGSNYGPAANDIRQALNGNLVYYLPFGQGQRLANQGGWINALVGGWQFSSIFYIRTGLPFTPIVSDDQSGAGTTWGHHVWRPNIVGNPYQAGNLSGNPGCTGPTKVKTIESWFNPCAFAQADVNTFGNLGRNTLYGPNWETVDIALLKNWPLKFLGEGGSLQFKWAVTDVFNHPNFGIPGRDLSSAGYGVITYANTSRQMQLGAKISF